MTVNENYNKHRSSTNNNNNKLYGHVTSWTHSKMTMDPKFGARSWAPPWGLTKADRAQNSKRDLSNLLYDSLKSLLLFDFESINYEIFFYCLLCSYFWVFVSNSGRRLSGMRNTATRGSSWRQKHNQKRGKRVNYAFCVVSIDDDDSEDDHHRHHLNFSSLLRLICVKRWWLAIFLDKFRNVGHDNN